MASTDVSARRPYGWTEICAPHPKAVYRAVAALNVNESTSRLCEDGGEEVAPGLRSRDRWSEMTSTDVPEVGSDWRINLDYPFNHAVLDLWRVGVNDHRCMVFGDPLRAPRGRSAQASPNAAERR